MSKYLLEEIRVYKRHSQEVSAMRVSIPFESQTWLKQLERKYFEADDLVEGVGFTYKAQSKLNDDEKDR